MARKLPKSFTSTPEEDAYFEKEKAASAPVEEEEEAAEVEEAPEEPAEEAEAESEPAESESSDETAPEESTTEEERPSRTVPIGALHEEREKRRQLQAKIEQMEATFQKLVDRVQQPTQAPLPAPDLPAIPTYEEDPVAHLKARLDQISILTGATHQHVQNQTAMTKFVEALGTLENQMRTTTPDYDAAIDFAKRSRDSELAALGYAPEQRIEMVRQEILNTAAFCMQRGQNPVEAFYNYAKVRGWDGSNGTPKPAPAKKLATVAKAQAASRSLPRGGTAPVTARSLEDLATMEDKDFDKFFDSVMRKT